MLLSFQGVKSQISVKTRQHPSAHSTSDKPFPALHVEEVGMIPNVHPYPMNTIGFSEHTINSPPLTATEAVRLLRNYLRSLAECHRSNTTYIIPPFSVIPKSPNGCQGKQDRQVAKSYK